METKEIKEGDYIRGFKAKDSEFIIDKKYLGAIAEVIEVSKYVIQVQFSDGKTWYYDIEQAIEHLAGNDTTYTLSDLKADFTNEYKKDNINPDHYKSKSKETI